MGPMDGSPFDPGMVYARIRCRHAPAADQAIQVIPTYESDRTAWPEYTIRIEATAPLDDTLKAQARHLTAELRGARDQATLLIAEGEDVLFTETYEG